MTPPSLQCLIQTFRFRSTFIQLLIGPHNRKFRAEEDVLSSRSTYFKEQFKKLHQGTDGECAVCLDGVDAIRADSCHACSLLFHRHCIALHLRSSRWCPKCYATWTRPRVHSDQYTFDQLDPEGFDVYMQWLYSYGISEYAADTADERCVRMLKAHLVGDILGDDDFLFAVRKEMVQIAAKSGLDYNVVAFAYNNTHEPCALRRFLVDLYALTGSMDQLKEGNVSHLFLVDMAQSFMAKSKEPGGEEYVRAQLAGEGHFENLEGIHKP